MSKKNHLLRCLNLLLPILFVFLLSVANLPANASSIVYDDSLPTWAKPNAMQIELIGPAPTAPDQPNFQSNLDCTQITYRRVNYNDMESGCFVRTAYGLVNPDNELVIFNGTDEALSVIPYSTNQILTPSPNSTDTLSLNPALTDGSYLGIYRNLAGTLSDQRDYLGGLVAKDVIAAQDFILKNTDGSRLVVNPQTMAFSSDGEWLVTETLNGSFVRINLTTLETVAFTQSFGTQGSPALLKSRVAVSSDGRFVAIENSSASSFKVYDLMTCVGDRTSIKPLDCENYDYWAYLNTEYANLGNINHLRFINDQLLGFRASYLGNYASFELAPTLDIKHTIGYLALGDSYTSGEGAFDYILGTDTAGNNCHLSLRSYPLLLTQRFYDSGGGHSVACSGAKINDILPLDSRRYKGQARDARSESQTFINVKSQLLAKFMPGYLPQTEFVSQYQPETITVSIGGNDIGFGTILQNCVMPHVSSSIWSQDCYDTYEDRTELQNLIDSVVPKWVLLFKHLSSAAPTSTVNVIGYPQIFYDKGNCALNVQLSNHELEFASELTDYLNGAIQKSAIMAGVNFIDISGALYGHRLCETASDKVAINGLTAGKDAGLFGIKVLGAESYHPNALGHSLIEKSISKQINIKRSVEISDAGQRLSNAPKTGRKIVALLPTSNMTQQIIVNGQVSTLDIDGASSGLKANETYSLALDRNKGPLISRITTNQSGDIAATFTLPSNTLTGGHTVDLIGVNQIGQTVDISQPIYVAVNGTDADGDGANDSSDSCPLEVNSGIDWDKDGIDDVCDGFIGSIQGNSNDATTGGAETSPKNSLMPSGRVTLNQAAKTPPTVPPIGQKIPIYSKPYVKSAASHQLTMSNWLNLTWRLMLLLIFLYAGYGALRKLIEQARVRINLRYADRRSLGQAEPMIY